MPGGINLLIDINVYNGSASHLAMLYFNPISLLTSLKHFTIKSISSFVWLAHTCVRILAFPFGTTGNENATT